MTEPFIASNGIEITTDPDGEGKVYLVGRRARGDEGQHLDTHATAGPEGIVALREFFQNEHDKELGRWRWPDNPQYVVYPRGDSGVRVLDEGSGIGSARLIHLNGDPDNPTGEYQAAYAYFEAHPERKPWEDAKPGEVWVLTFDGADDTFKAYESRSGTIYFTRSRETSANLTDERITAGRRIWPEDAS